MIKLKDLLEAKLTKPTNIGDLLPDMGDAYKQFDLEPMDWARRNPGAPKFTTPHTHRNRPFIFHKSYGTNRDYGKDAKGVPYAGAGDYLNNNWYKLKDNERVLAIDDYLNDMQDDIEASYLSLEPGDESHEAGIQQMEYERDRAYALGKQVQKRRFAKLANKERKRAGMMGAVGRRERPGAPGPGYMESVSSKQGEKK